MHDGIGRGRPTVVRWSGVEPAEVQQHRSIAGEVNGRVAVSGQVSEVHCGSSESGAGQRLVLRLTAADAPRIGDVVVMPQ